MPSLTRTRELLDQHKDHMSEAARTSFLGIIDAFENGRFGRMDALLQLQLTTVGPAAGADPTRMKEILACLSRKPTSSTSGMLLSPVQLLSHITDDFSSTWCAAPKCVAV